MANQGRAIQWAHSSRQSGKQQLPPRTKAVPEGCGAEREDYQVAPRGANSRRTDPKLDDRQQIPWTTSIPAESCTDATPPLLGRERGNVGEQVSVGEGS